MGYPAGNEGWIKADSREYTHDQSTLATDWIYGHPPDTDLPTLGAHGYYGNYVGAFFTIFGQVEDVKADVPTRDITIQVTLDK